MSRINYSEFYKNINFDVNSQLKETYVVKQNDTLSRGFYVKVIQNGRVVQPTEYDKMTLYVKKPDGKDIFEEGTISFDRFKIGLPNQALTVPGTMRAEFTLRGADGEVISSKDFTIIVNESFPVDPVESTDEFGALQSALAQIAGFAGELQDAQLFAESIKANLGELDDLDTVDKENAVAAINELNGKIDNVLNSEELETLLTAKVDKDTLGDMSQLETEEKEILVLAINELFNSIEEVKEVSDVSTLLPLLNSKADKSTVGDIASLVDFGDEQVEVNNLVEAVNYTYQLLIDSFEGIGEINLEGLALSEDLGDKTTLTTTDKTNLVNAINEINQALKEVESVTDVEQLSILLSGKADKSSVGNLSELNTTQKNNLVAAINELNAQIGDVDLSEIFTLLEGKVSQEDFDTAVNVLQSNIDTIELTPGPQGEPGQPGADGADGKSAYQIWLDAGNSGTEQDFLESLEGVKKIVEGLSGGTNSSSSYTSASLNIEVLQSINVDSIIVDVGILSSYSLFIDDELIGTVSNNVGEITFKMIDSVLQPGIYNIKIEATEPVKMKMIKRGTFTGKYFKMSTGATFGDTKFDSFYLPIKLKIIETIKGQPGQDGADGLSAYQIWLNEGNQGTEQDFLDSLEGPQGPPGGGEGGGDNLGSHSSDKTIENYTNEYQAQVNASKDSSATAMTFELLINISETEVERWMPVDMSELDGTLDPFYLVDGSFVYAEVQDWGDDEVYIDLVPKDYGPETGAELYPVKMYEGSASSQVNASLSSEASGSGSQVNASQKSEASGISSQVNVSYGSEASGIYSQVNSSSRSTASGSSSQVNSSDRSTASGSSSQVNSSDRSTASGSSSQVNASKDSTASWRYSQVNASEKSIASQVTSQVNASVDSIASNVRTQVNASYKVINNTQNSSAWGLGVFGTDPSTQNIKIHLLSQSGNINHSGVLNSGHNFTDYAELFPNLVGEEQGYGLIQTIDGHGVRPANSGDQVVGVTSATAGVVLGETSFSWAERWLKDEWGAFIMEDVVDEDWEPGEGQTEEDRPVHRLPKENPEYDPEREYAKRQERPDEWTVVGLVGQVYVRLDENVEPMDYVKPLKDGIGQTSSEPTSIRVMKITQEFDKDKGYKIGFCLLK